MQPLLEMQAGIELPSSAQGRGRCSVRAIPSSERVLKISRNAALAKAPAIGRQRHGDMELLVGIDADYDVWMVSPLGPCQCC
jgi:hypothetical protein